MKATDVVLVHTVIDGNASGERRYRYENSPSLAKMIEEAVVKRNFISSITEGVRSKIGQYARLCFKNPRDRRISGKYLKIPETRIWLHIPYHGITDVFVVIIPYVDSDVFNIGSHDHRFWFWNSSSHIQKNHRHSPSSQFSARQTEWQINKIQGFQAARSHHLQLSHLKYLVVVWVRR